MSGASRDSVGGMTVDLDMPTGELDRDVKRAEGILDRFSGKMGVVAGAAAAAGTMIGTYLVRGVMMARTQINNAIKEVDDLNDAALRVGVSVEQFSALGFAAKMSGGDLQSLEQALKGLSNKMDEAARNSTGLAARAFNAFGVEVKDSTGKLRTADQVLLDLADTFAKMNDGPQKTALSIDLFTRAGGTMIQMLNEGKAGIKAFMDQAKELGLVVNQEAASAMAKWMDDTDKLNLQLEGLWRTIAMNVIPIIDSLAIAGRRTAAGFHGMAMEVGAAIEMMGNLVSKGPEAAWTRYLNVLDQVGKENKKIASELEASIAAINNRPLTVKRQTNEADLVVDDGKAKTAEKEKQLAIEQLFGAALDANNEKQEFNNSIREIELQQYASLNEARYLTLEQFAYLNQLHAEGTILTQEYNAAMMGLSATMNDEFGNAADKIISNLKRIEHFFENVSDGSASSWLAMGDTMVDTLSTVFGESKEFAIAETIINTAQAIMKTMASLPFPANVAAAAAVAAMGVAQIAKISSTNKGSKSAPSVSAGSASAAAAAPAQGPQQTLFVQGIDPGKLYSGEAVRNLAESLLQYQRDGGIVVLNKGP